jgi:hypothetical protein
MSQQYFDMVFNNDKLGNVLALGPEVSFMNNGVYLKVVNPPVQEIPEPTGHKD